MRRLIGWVALCCAVSVVGIGVIRLTLPRGEPPARQAVLAPGKCPMPCVLGIRPGVTPIQDAVQILRSSPYIDPNSIALLSSGEGTVTYTANWRHPAEMFSTTQAKSAGQDLQIRAGAGDHLVQTVIIQINLPLGAFLPLFGPPPRSGLTYYQAQGLFYVMEYPALGMQYMTWADCKQGQSIASLIGTTYMLQSPNNFISELNSADALRWHGFTTKPFDQMVQQYQCPSVESPLNGWFARLFG